MRKQSSPSSLHSFTYLLSHFSNISSQWRWFLFNAHYDVPRSPRRPIYCCQIIIIHGAAFFFSVFCCRLSFAFTLNTLLLSCIALLLYHSLNCTVYALVSCVVLVFQEKVFLVSSSALSRYMCVWLHVRHYLYFFSVYRHPLSSLADRDLFV